MLRSVSATYVIALALCAAQSAEAELRFRFVQLASPSTAGTVQANAISDTGHIAGMLTHSTQFLYQGVYWPDGHQPPILIAGEGQEASSAIDVNGAGTVVGSAGEGSLAFLWNAGADLVTLENLVTCFSCNSGAAAINDRGIIVGSSTFPSGEVHAVRWIDGEIRDIGALPADCCSYALGVNQGGTVCGSSDTRAVMWTGTTILDLQVLDNANNVAHAVNNSNDIVGESFSNGPFFPTRPFRWSSGIAQDLGTFGDEHVSGSARSINDAGWIVGSSFLHLPPSPIHACLWRNGQLIDLNDAVINLPANSYLENAADINNGNEIVGSGWFANHQGAFLLEPIPPADINADGVVNVPDLLAVINAWGACGGSPCAADVNEDGAVNVADLLAVISHWG